MVKDAAFSGSFAFSDSVYYWRKSSEKQREEIREYRRLHGFPKHTPPHFDSEYERQYLLSGSCYEHKKIIGATDVRMTDFEADLLSLCREFNSELYAWCILPNHYHVLMRTARMKELRKEIGRLNGRTSYKWNGEDNARGRKVWHNCFERKMRSERHFFATLNYVLHNPVHHGYVERWDEWKWSNAVDYLDDVGRERAIEIWKEYPILDYGKKWDVD